MSKLQAAVVQEQRVTFVVALVKNHVIDSPSQAAEMMRAVAVKFGHPLVVLMGESNGRLHGNRQDVLRFVSKLHPSRLPWKTWDV